MRGRHLVHPDSETLARWDRETVWHPFTQMAAYAGESQLIIERGDGPYLFDLAGRRYIDGVASMWCNVHGHRHPVIDAAVRAQLARVAHSTLLGLGNVPSIELARRIVDLFQRGLADTSTQAYHLFYSDDGATAVEVAIKIAFQYWRQRGPKPEHRPTFVSFANAYHGDTLGAVSIGGIDLFHGAYRPLLFEALHAPAPYCYRCSLGLEFSACGLACAQALESVLANHAGAVAAVVVEPLVQGAAGILTAPPGFLERVRAACDRHGVLLIADEVAVGFGRTGTMFACEQEHVRPDLLCLGKGITGGYLPVAATLVSDEVYQAFLGDATSGRTFHHGHTYTGNPLGCAAGLASLDVFEYERTLDGIEPRAALVAERLAQWAAFEHVGDCRQRGLMAGVELVADRAAKTPHAPARRVSHRVILEARRRGLILRPLGDTIVLMPPLNIPLPVLDEMLDITAESIKTVTTDVE
jgi:adenosylmethionine-8-amino-7-oxononanoate aminotransferase